jgi:hypothetical protein
MFVVPFFLGDWGNADPLLDCIPMLHMHYALFINRTYAYTIRRKSKMQCTANKGPVKIQYKCLVLFMYFQK